MFKPRGSSAFCGVGLQSPERWSSGWRDRRFWRRLWSGEWAGQLWTRPALLARLPANTPASQENLESLMACTDTDVIACDVQCASNARNGNLSRSTVSFAPILGGYREVFSANLEANTSGFLRGPAVFTSADLLRCVSKLGLQVRINGL